MYDNDFYMGVARTFRRLIPDYKTSIIRGPGIYIITELNLKDRTFDILYIGSGKSVYKRLFQGKHKMDYYISNQFSFNDVVYPIFCISCENYLEREIDMIKYLRPKFNIKHNG